MQAGNLKLLRAHLFWAVAPVSLGILVASHAEVHQQLPAEDCDKGKSSGVMADECRIGTDKNAWNYEI